MKLTLINPKELSEEQFNSLRGSEMHASMVRNRIVVLMSDRPVVSPDHVMAELRAWLLGNCTSAFYIGKEHLYKMETEGKRYACTVYIEENVAVSVFRLFMHEGEINDPPPPPSGGNPFSNISDAWTKSIERAKEEEMRKKRKEKNQRDLMRRLGNK